MENFEFEGIFTKELNEKEVQEVYHSALYFIYYNIGPPFYEHYSVVFDHHVNVPENPTFLETQYAKKNMEAIFEVYKRHVNRAHLAMISQKNDEDQEDDVSVSEDSMNSWYFLSSWYLPVHNYTHKNVLEMFDREYSELIRKKLIRFGVYGWDKNNRLYLLPDDVILCVLLTFL